MNTLSQIFGVIAFIMFIISLQCDKKKYFITFQLVANVLYLCQYSLISIWTAALMNLITIIRCGLFLLYSLKGKEPPKGYMYGFICAIIVIGMLSYTDYLSLIPICITILYTIALWQKNMSILRYLFLLASCFWIIYNLSVGAYASLIGNLFEIISGVSALIRFRKKKSS